MRQIDHEIYKSILDRIGKDGSFIIKDIAKDSGYSITTVNKYVQAQVARGLISELSQKKTDGRGRKAITYCLGQDKSVVIGVDVKASEIIIGAMDFAGKMIREAKFRDFKLDNTYESLESLCRIIEDFISSCSEISRSNIKAVMICLSGRVNSKKGTSASILNLEETTDVPLATLVGEKIGMKVFLTNDSKAMAYGEYNAHFKDKYKDVLYVNMSWGLGMGIIIDGKIYNGKDDYSGEFGHMHAFDNNILCRCGKKGCLETEVSGLAISRKLTERITRGITSVLTPKVRRRESVDMSDILNAMSKEDTLCIELVGQAGIELGHRLAGIMNLLNPELIILGGSFSMIDPCYFLQYVSLGVHQYSLKLISSDVPIIKSFLGERAAVFGSCLMARKYVLESDDAEVNAIM